VVFGIFKLLNWSRRCLSTLDEMMFGTLGANDWAQMRLQTNYLLALFPPRFDNSSESFASAFVASLNCLQTETLAGRRFFNDILDAPEVLRDKLTSFHRVFRDDFVEFSSEDVPLPLSLFSSEKVIDINFLNPPDFWVSSHKTLAAVPIIGLVDMWSRSAALAFSHGLGPMVMEDANTMSLIFTVTDTPSSSEMNAVFVDVFWPSLPCFCTAFAEESKTNL
jgi:hypothetical protein